MTDIDLLQLFSEAAEAQSENTAGESSEPTENIAVVTPPEEGAEAGTDEEFEQLIKGKYRDSFKKRTQGIIDKRFAKMKSYENTFRVCAPLFERIARDFPDIAPADTERLVNAFLERDSETVREKEQSELLQSVEEKLKVRKALQLRERLLRESEELREIYPSFDLLGELSSSKQLNELLAAGIPLRRAYECVNLEKIMGSALRYAVARTAGNTAETLRSRSRIKENSLSDRASSVKRADVKNLTEKDIMRIIAEVGKGAKISF